MRRLAAATLLILAPLAALAGEQTLSGPEITELLTGATVEGEGWRQEFHASGATTYAAGRPSEGRWSVRGDAYCSIWPPSDRWTCYAMARRDTQEGTRLIWTGPAGDRSEALIVTSGRKP